MAKSSSRTALRLRLMHGERIAMGPGKAELLECIRETGSISAAGRRMQMSYKRAWQLIEEMNACFRVALVEASRGGRGGGGARLTPVGADVLERFRRIEQACRDVARDDLASIRRQLGRTTDT